MEDTEKKINKKKVSKRLIVNVTVFICMCISAIIYNSTEIVYAQIFWLLCLGHFIFSFFAFITVKNKKDSDTYEQ